MSSTVELLSRWVNEVTLHSCDFPAYLGTEVLQTSAGKFTLRTGSERIELSLVVLETTVLPLNELPICSFFTLVEHPVEHLYSAVYLTLYAGCFSAVPTRRHRRTRTYTDMILSHVPLPIGLDVRYGTYLAAVPLGCFRSTCTFNNPTSGFSSF